MNPLLIRRRGMMVADTTPPDGQLEYIETDGKAFLLIANLYMTPPPKSCHAKIRMGSNTYCGLIGGYSKSSGSSNYAFSFLKYSSNSKGVIFCYYYNYSPVDGTPYVTYSIDNDKPFEVKVALRVGKQEISVKQEDTNTWGSVVTKGQTAPISGNYTLRIFTTVENDNQTSIIAPSGTRMYFVKVYSDFTYTNLVGDFVGWRQNGIVGMKNLVDDTFWTNYNTEGEFTGGPNVI